MKQSHLIAVNTLIIWGTTVLQVLPPLILVPFLVRSLGDSGYGQYALIWSLLVAIEQLEISLQSGGIKYGAAFLAQDRIGDLNRVLSSTSVFSMALGTLAGLAVIATALVGYSHTPEMKISLVIVGAMMFIRVPTTPYLGIIRTKQLHYIVSLSSIAAQYSGLLLVVLWFKLAHPSVEALIAISAGTILVSRLALVPVAYRLVPGLENRPRFFDWEIFRYILAFGAVTVFAALCLIVNSTGMRWMAGLLVSTSFVAHLAIFLMPGNMVSQVVQAMTVTVMPAASAYQATDNTEMLQELLLKTTRYIVVLVAAVIVAAILIVRPVLRLWVGPAYEFLDVYVLINLAGVAILLSTSCAHQMLKGIGRLRQVLVAYVIGLAIVPTASFLALFLTLKAPYAAVSVALLLGNITAAVLQMRACAKAVRLDGIRLVLRGYLQPLIPAAASLALVLVVKTLAGWNGTVARLGLATVGVALLFGMFYFLVAGGDERRQFLDFAQMVRGRLSGIFRNVSPSSESSDV
jgi:O-antigen/teichoic acid export membrane protein